MRRVQVLRALVFATVAATVSARVAAFAQSADAVLCDRVAADPNDLEKPADVKGVATIPAADVSTAIKFCKTAASGPRRMMYQLGRAHAASGQMSEAIAAYRRASDKGHTTAMVELGVILANGTGVAKDEAAARKLFEKAADAGNPRGITNLAVLSGGSTGADPAKTRALLAKAAEGNSPVAQYQLGLMFQDGVGGTKDDTAARGMFEKAAAQEHPGALERMGAYALAGRGGPKDTDAAKSYYQKAAALGNDDAKAALKRAECSITIKDKSGKRVTDLCF